MNPVMQRAKELEPLITSFMQRLIRARSFSSEEKEVTDLICAQMNQNGFDEVYKDGLGNVIGRIGNGKTKIAIDAHIDTVEEGDVSLWTKPVFEGFRDGGYIYGRGASDQKGGICSAVYAAKIIKELDLCGDFTLYVTATVMEEDCDGMCWRYIIEKDGIKPDIVLITEPTSLNIYRGHRGRLEFRIRTSGVSAHASAPQRGQNAIYKMAKIINEIEKLNECLEEDEFLGKGSIVVSQIFFTSPSANAVPDSCEIQLDRRIIPSDSKEKIFGQIRQAIARAGVDSAKIIELTYEKPSYTSQVYPVEKFFPSWVISEQSMAVKAAVHTYTELFGTQPVIDKWTFSTNGTVTAGVYNIPTIGFGPGEEKYAHAPDERVEIDHLIKACAFYASFPMACMKFIT